ncbi:MAG: SpoIIE family protein phosphatase [Rubripirellula sp.]
MRSITTKQKKCLEVVGGRLSYDAHYSMPGLAMQICSRQTNGCRDGGGEVHFVSSCASGRITRMMIADICGSEETFRRLSCEMRDGVIRSINSIWQNKVVENVGHQFREFAKQGGCGTATVATYFAPTRSFVMCNIGNPPLLVFRAREQRWEAIHGETRVVERAGETVDGLYGESEYRHIRTKLEPDDTIVMYGNGFAQSAFPTGGIVGHTRLLESLQESPHSNPESRVEHLIGLIRDSSATEEESTIIICRVTNTGTRLRDNLLAPLRMFQRPADSTAFA